MAGPNITPVGGYAVSTRCMIGGGSSAAATNGAAATTPIEDGEFEGGVATFTTVTATVGVESPLFRPITDGGDVYFGDNTEVDSYQGIDITGGTGGSITVYSFDGDIDLGDGTDGFFKAKFFCSY